MTSPSLLVLRDLGFCFESEGELHHRLATDRLYPPPERLAAEAESRTWYRKSEDVWTTWNTRNAATPESERERRKVEHVLKKPDTEPAAGADKTTENNDKSRSKLLICRAYLGRGVDSFVRIAKSSAVHGRANRAGAAPGRPGFGHSTRRAICLIPYPRIHAAWSHGTIRELGSHPY